MTRKYYARWRNLLDGWRPRYYSFDSVSDRNEWIQMGIEEGGEGTSYDYCLAREARNHNPIPTRWVSNRRWGTNLSEMAGGWKYG